MNNMAIQAYYIDLGKTALAKKIIMLMPILYLEHKNNNFAIFPLFTCLFLSSTTCVQTSISQ